MVYSVHSTIPCSAIFLKTGIKEMPQRILVWWRLLILTVT